MNNDARVMLWGSMIGAVTWLEDRGSASSSTPPTSWRAASSSSPIVMPLAEFPYEFPALSRETFRGLPGLLADSLPDKYGNALIDAWLASEGRTPDELPSRGAPLLRRHPRHGGARVRAGHARSAGSRAALSVAKLVDLANRVLGERAGLGGVFSGEDDREAISDILRVGTSAGGARAKAILAWNPASNEFRSGQVKQGAGFEHWLMKFDGVASPRDAEIATPRGYGLIEYAYHLMAVEAGIDMTACRLHHEGGRSHFMTRRFDRTAEGGKLHMQSLGAMAHFDLQAARELFLRAGPPDHQAAGSSAEDVEQQVLRAFFNVVGRNRDDHVKNIAFLMNRRGEWRSCSGLRPLLRVESRGEWTSRHQMSLNGKREGFERDDLLALTAAAGIKSTRAGEMLDRTIAAVRRWPDFAAEAGVPKQRAREIRRNQRVGL